MATSTYSYRRSTNQVSSSGDRDLQSKLQQARRDRTAFYRRMAETGARLQAGEDGVDVDVDVDTETSTRRRFQRLDTASPSQCDAVSSVSTTNSSLMGNLPEPRSSWRYYTSYDNGEWRRHATPIYKADAELDSEAMGKLTDSRSAISSMTTGLTSHGDIIDIEDDEGASSHSRQSSALGRRQRLRGSACLTRDLQPTAASSSTTDTGPTTLEEVKLVMKDVFDRSRYGTSYDVSELVQKILGERPRHRDPSPSQTEDRVIYANPDRQSILDNVTPALRPTLVAEIPEGGDEKDFVEKTLAPSGRRWTSSPSPDSQQIVVVRSAFDDEYLDGGLRYEDIGAAASAGARACGTSLENWRESSCQSPSNVPGTPNGERMEVGGFEPRRTTEMARHHESQSITETSSTTKSRKDTFGRHIPADAVEIKVQRNDEQPSPSTSRLYDDRSSTEEHWLCSNGDKRSSAADERSFTGSNAIKTDEQMQRSRGDRRQEIYSSQVKNIEITPRTSSDDEWSRVAGTKSAGRTSTEDGRIWIPVIHVSGTPPTKNAATKSSPHPVETEREIRIDEAASDRQVGFSSRPVTEETGLRSGAADSRQFTRHTEVAESSGAVRQSAATSSSLRTGSGVGSYGFRSSIVVDRGSARDGRPVVQQTSRSGDGLENSASGGEWIVEKAL